MGQLGPDMESMNLGISECGRQKFSSFVYPIGTDTVETLPDKSLGPMRNQRIRSY